MSRSVAVCSAHHEYSVKIGARLDIAAAFATLGAVDKYILLYDKALEDSAFLHHIRTLVATLAPYQAIAITSGEASKSLTYYSQLMERILEGRVTRTAVVVNVGGGVVGDLGGFVAASLLRGVRFVQIPTTLLAQVDSSIGGKVGINAQAGKNLIGAFHQPEFVLADLDSLHTLPEDVFAAGMAEVIKAALLADADFLTWLAQHHEAIVARDTALLEQMIACAVNIKATVVHQDTEERHGQRALLNLGHTFAHGIERLNGYDSQRISHGQAVAVGMVMAADLSARLGMITLQDVAYIKTVLRHYHLPTDAHRWSNRITPADLWQAMQYDKKNQSGGLNMTLLARLGQAVVQAAPDLILVQAVIADNLRAG